MWHVWGKAEMQTGFWWGSLNERENLEDPSTDGYIKMVVREDGRAWNGLILFRTGTSGWLL
jgi:hypothetical protein